MSRRSEGTLSFTTEHWQAAEIRDGVSAVTVASLLAGVGNRSIVLSGSLQQVAGIYACLLVVDRRERIPATFNASFPPLATSAYAYGAYKYGSSYSFSEGEQLVNGAVACSSL